MRIRAGSSSEKTPPRKGWEYLRRVEWQYLSKGKWQSASRDEWHHDPDMECGKPSSHQCKSVSVKLSGKTSMSRFLKILCLGKVNNQPASALF